MATIKEAIEAAVKLRPHYVHLLYQLYPVSRIGSGGITADRFMRLYYDPDVIETWELEWAASEIIAQVESYARRHSLRQDGRNDICWKVATSISIRDCLTEEGLKFHPQSLYPETFGLPDGLCAEEYHLRLWKMCSRRRRDVEQKLSEIAGVELPDFGSAGSEELEEWELPEDADVPTIDAMVALMMQKDMQPEQTKPGVLPGDEERHVAEERSSEQDWRHELSTFYGTLITMRAGVDDWSYLVDDPEVGLNHGILMPGMTSTDSTTYVVVDTSSSMGDDRISTAMGEVGGIIRARQGTVFVLSCDAGASAAKEAFHVSQVKLIGNGGTDMGIGIRAAETSIPRA